MSTESAQKDDGRVADDILYGANAIAEEMGLEPRQVYHLHRQRKLGFVKNFAGKLAASRTRIRAEMRQLLGAPADAQGLEKRR